MADSSSKMRPVDVTHLLRPDRAELYYEVKDTFDRYIRELRADRSWEAGAYRPLVPGRSGACQAPHKLLGVGT